MNEFGNMAPKIKKILIIIIIVILNISILFIYGCFFPFGAKQGSRSRYEPEIVVTYKEAVRESDYTIPETRPFLMGFTPFPYDFSQDALDFTYANINYHSDLVIQHLDNGIPWEEALEDSDFPDGLIYDFNDRVSRTGEDKAIYLAITPLSNNRNSIAGYWRESQYLELTEKWKAKSFSDHDVMQAYLNYCKFVIEKFEPEYFAYGIEVNMLGYHDPQAFGEFLVLAENVYKSLKESYPDLPIFLTIQLETFLTYFEDQENIVKSLLPFTDYIAISSYPFGNFAYPGDIPDDWFSRLYDMSPEKPVAIAETAYLAEDLTLERFNGNTIEGSQDYQLEYLDLLFNQMAGIDCRFITWFVIRDYDQAWLVMEEQGADEIIKSWRDTGLIDEAGKPRKALDYWDSWLSLPK